MATNNFVRLSGKLMYDVKVLTGAKGGEYAKIKVEVKRDGKKGYDSIDVTLFGEPLDIVRNLKKGAELDIQGYIQSGSYQKDGKTIYTMSIVADTIKIPNKNNSIDMGSEADEIIDTFYTQDDEDILPF